MSNCVHQNSNACFTIFIVFAKGLGISSPFDVMSGLNRAFAAQAGGYGAGGAGSGNCSGGEHQMHESF